MIRRIIMGVRRRIRSIHPKVNNRIKESNWYNNLFPHLTEYKRLQQGADVLCVGSTPAKNAIDFRSFSDMRGYNLAVCPETIFYDFQVVKNYHSFLKAGGTFVFVLCPFTFLKDKYNEREGEYYENLRYYPILHRAMIDNFNYKLYRKWVEEPLLIGKEAWKRLIKDTPRSKSMEVQTNPNTPEESKNFCEERVNKWMKEFNLPDLNPENIPESIESAIETNLKIYVEMKQFVQERGYKALIVIPPFPEEMVSLLPSDLVEHTLFEPVKQIGIPYLSYFGKKEWLSRDLYYHGFLLNAKGRELFTKEIITRIQR